MVGLLTVLQPPWMAHARCRSVDPALFYPRKADDSVYAKRVCDSCPVAAECPAKLAWARDVLTEKAAQQQPVPPPTSAPAPVAARTPGVAAQPQPTVGQLIAAGRASGSKRISAQADRVADGITKLGDMLAAERAKVEARRARDAAAQSAREEVLRLEKQLADARAKLRGPRPHRGLPRPGEYACTVDGCDRTFDTSQGRALHQRRAHQ